MVNPPKPGDESYELYQKERAAELASLRRRAHMVTDGFNALDGVTCNFTEGAMYSFPRVRVGGCFVSRDESSRLIVLRAISLAVRFEIHILPPALRSICHKRLSMRPRRSARLRTSCTA